MTPDLVKVIQNASPMPSRKANGALTNRQTDKLTDKNRRTSVPANTRTNGQTDKQTDRRTSVPANKQTDRQTNMKINITGDSQHTDEIKTERNITVII